MDLGIEFKKYDLGFSDPEEHKIRTKPGLSKDLIVYISKVKNEPEWMLNKRLEAYELFLSLKKPDFGPDLSEIDFDKITYFLRASDRPSKSWEDVPEYIKTTFDKIGVPESEKKYLAGVGAQYESEVVYHNLKKEWESQGVIFCDMDTAVKLYSEIIKAHFGTIVPAKDNLYAALNTACWSGGSFVYVPRGVKLESPLQAYFRINARSVGQFERTMIIAEPDSQVTYVEGCSAPVNLEDSLHAAVVEVIVGHNARVRYTTIQNWSNNVINLVTKRAVVQSRGLMEWVDCNLGSKITMKYPASYLVGESAKAEFLSLAVAGCGQIIDAGCKAVHLAPFTTSNIVSKSISLQGGINTFRSLIKVGKKANHAVVSQNCDAFLLDNTSGSNTEPKIINQQAQTKILHEASVFKIDETKLLYLMSKGLSREDSVGVLINGFVEPIVRQLPMEYAVEMNRLISLSMEGGVG